MNTTLIRSILLAFLILPFLAFAQTGNKGGAKTSNQDSFASKKVAVQKERVEDFADEEPFFPNLSQYLGENLIYPASAVNDGIEGNVIVKFVVEKDGSISNVEFEKTLRGDCDEEVIRVLTNMPPWTPGKTDGKPVRIWSFLTVRFTLPKDAPKEKPEKKTGKSPKVQ